MGGGSKQTAGYWFNWLLHFCWSDAADALLELRASDAPFWQGRVTTNTQLQINQPTIWGDVTKSEGEGGVVGTWDVCFGEEGQTPNAYLASVLGPKQSAHLGKFCTVAEGGKFGAYDSTPKSVSAKIERILADPPNGVPWYPEKAAIPLSGVALQVTDNWKYLMLLPPDNTLDASSSTFDDGNWAIGPGFFGSSAEVGGSIGTYIPTGVAGRVIWLRNAFAASPRSPIVCNIYHDDGAWLWVNGVQVFDASNGVMNGATVVSTGILATVIVIPATLIQSVNVIALKVEDAVPSGVPTNILAGLSLNQAGTQSNAMNPAHMLYESIVHEKMQNEPAGLVNNDSFQAAADQLFTENFGLCTTWDASQETPMAFQQRICNVIGAALTQSRVDGTYYLDLIRAVTDTSNLPVITDDDILSIKITPSTLSESTNCVRVEWFDPGTKLTRTTPPVRAAGAVQSSGAIIQTLSTYHEIPAEALALRVAQRDLIAMNAPLSKIEITVLHRFAGLRIGTCFVLQSAKEQIASMVCVIGKIDWGTLTDSKITITATQHVFSLPDTTYVQPQPPQGGAGPLTIPIAATAEIAFEAPYIELAAAMSPSQLAALTTDSSYLCAAAGRPQSGFSFQLATGLGSTTPAVVTNGDWCGACTVTNAAGYLDGAAATLIAIAAGTDLDRVSVGDWAYWDAEIVRVDAIDTAGMTLQLGRGCADTIPGEHGAGSQIYFCGSWLAYDPTEYVGGDVVHARVLTATATDVLSIDSAPDMSVAMADRASLPYAPGNVQINGALPWGNPAITGAITLTWSHRARVLQADKLIDFTQNNVGPDAGTSYALQVYDASNNLVTSITGISGTSVSYVPPSEGSYVVQLFAQQNGKKSWQTYSFPLSITQLSVVRYATEDGTGSYLTEDGTGYYQIG